jgi:TrmH family RNA methyltransferase
VSARLRAVQAARGDPRLVVLEGFHAVKHALRFGAEVTQLFAADPDAVRALAAELAPDLIETLAGRTIQAAPVVPEIHTGVIAVARRPPNEIEAVLRQPGAAPVVLLENPRRLGNVGAAIRVAAAADAAGFAVTGTGDPWDPSALRGSAGLHFALPVGRIQRLETRRPLVGLTPDGEDFTPGELPVGAVLAFGTERHGLSWPLLERCESRVAIPMRAGVSSLNLATAVAAVLFAWRLATGWPGSGPGVSPPAT